MWASRSPTVVITDELAGGGCTGVAEVGCAGKRTGAVGGREGEDQAWGREDRAWGCDGRWWMMRAIRWTVRIKERQNGRTAEPQEADYSYTLNR
jgi:hypothetical protein